MPAPLLAGLNDLRIVMRVPERCSSYKRALVDSSHLRPVIATRLAGDFVLPRDLAQPLAFLAGGVGVAPFRSMASYVVDKRLPCDVVLLYWCHRADEFVFRPAFEAVRSLGWRTEYLVSGRAETPDAGEARACPVSAEGIRAEVPDFATRMFYVSGSHGMVSRTEAALREIGVGRSRTRRDYFDGLVDV